MKDNLSEILSEASNSIGITLGEKEIALFQEYYRILLFWNNKINLVSIKSDIDVPVKHFIDSMIPLRFIENKESSIIDIGTGAGFPGIPMKIAANRLKLSLVDSSRKKMSFLKHLIRKLQLVNTTTVNRRAELIINEDIYRENFDIIISRASFKLPQFLKTGHHFIHTGGILIAMKGINIEAELRQAEKISRTVGLEYYARHEIRLPITQDTRNIIIFKKTK